MWYFANALLKSRVDHGESMLDAFEATIRALIVSSAVFCLISVLFTTSTWSGEQIQALFAILMPAGLILALANYLLEKKQFLLSLTLWISSVAFSVMALSWLMHNSSLMLLCSVLPLIAAITIHGWGGLATEAFLVALTWFASLPIFGGVFNRDYLFLVASVGAFSGLLGWICSRQLLDVALWSMKSYDSARTILTNLQTHQVELEQAQEDLNLANSELGRLSQRLKALERIAEDARQATTEFVANVSHELRTPLNMIIGYADLISHSPKVYGGRLPASLMTDILAILRNAQHLSNLVNDVLDLSQVEAGRMAISRMWVPLEDTIADALEVVKGLFESKGLYLNSEIQPELPKLYFDQTRIRQVIINLLSNAGRFTEQGGVTLRCYQRADEIIIDVSDTGPGIAEKDQERIFEPFQQADVSIRRRYGGSGLGLTISKQFVEMHGGRMWLVSHPGQGTTFSVSLPIEHTSPQSAANLHNSLLRAIVPDDQIGYRLRTRRSHAPHPSTKERFVVVDHDLNLLRLMNRYLPDNEVERMEDMSSAVEALNRSPAQALILNYPHPDKLPDGALGRIPFGTPAITCWLPGEHDAAKRLGVVDYLIKPISQEKLISTLETFASAAKTVLIVDDEEDELHLFARNLEAKDKKYRILQVTNGVRALSMLRSRKPDVMVLDLNMPGMDGFRVLEEKKRDPEICDIPVIVVSARDPSGDPIVSDTFSVMLSGGIPQRKMIECIQSISEILAPSPTGLSEA